MEITEPQAATFVVDYDKRMSLLLREAHVNYRCLAPTIGMPLLGKGLMKAVVDPICAKRDLVCAEVAALWSSLADPAMLLHYAVYFPVGSFQRSVVSVCLDGNGMFWRVVLKDVVTDRSRFRRLYLIHGGARDVVSGDCWFLNCRSLTDV